MSVTRVAACSLNLLDSSGTLFTVHIYLCYITLVDLHEANSTRAQEHSPTVYAFACER